MSNSIHEFDRLMLDYLKGDITPEDRQRMTELLHKDASCREKYREMSRAYAIASVPWFERRKKQNLDFLREKLDLRSSPGRTLVRRVRVGSFAAMVALLIGLGIRLIYLNNHPAEVIVPPVSYCRIEIPQGAQSKLILPDSTSVYLNGGTIIKYDASFQNKAEREVYLNGEAYFEVAKNAEKPFIVHAADLNVKVLGTKFNVSSYPDEPNIKVSLVEGRVKVSTASDGVDKFYLSPNEQAVYDKAKKTLSVRAVDAGSQVAWTTGRLVFVNETLFHILKTIGKKYDVQILIQSRKVNTEYFSGSIDADLTLDEILSYLDVDNKFVWRRKGKTVVIADR